MKEWTIGILTPYMDSFFFGDVIYGIAQRAAYHNNKLMSIVTAIHYSTDKEYEFNFRVGWDMVDAWIVISEAVNEDYMQQLAQTGKPIVTISTEFPNIEASSIKSDNRAGMAEATKHLIELGHTRIAFIGDLTNRDFYERFQGYKDALEQSGIPYDESLTYRIGSFYRDTVNWAEKMSAQNELPFTALVGQADIYTIKAMEVFRRQGYRIPEDIAFVGYDDSGLATKCKPKLTTVRQPIISLGMQAIDQVNLILSGRSERAESIVLPSNLIIRESTAGRLIDKTSNDQTLTTADLDGHQLGSIIESHHLMIQNMFKSNGLSWLKWTNQHWGCLSLWSQAKLGASRGLMISQAYSSKDDKLPQVGAEFREEQFPPLDLMPVKSDPSGVEIAIVQLIYSEAQQYGFIVTVGPVNDRLLRCVDTRQLPPMIAIMNEHQMLVSDLKAREASIHQLAYNDHLTGLANRRFFYEKLDEVIQIAEVQKNRVAILVIDLDHFKVVNDSLGHDKGDELLCHAAKVIREQVGDRGVVARIGGDEFMVIIPNVGHKGEIDELCVRIHLELRKPTMIDGNELFAAASVGVSWYPDHGLNSSELVKMADNAMYLAKQLGRSRTETYSTNMDFGMNDRLTISNKLRRAVESMDSFSLHYQPQVDLNAGMLVGMEALLRWDNPTTGGITPDVFIPLAETIGLIVPIGYWVLREACSQLKAWEDKVGDGLVMSVNLSAKQLQQPDFVEMVGQIIEESGVDPTHLCFEITETTALGDMGHVLSILNQLLNRGIHIALDDFGTGYSSLSVLNQLPLRTIKIDRSFIRDMHAGSDHIAIVTAIVAMAKSLKLHVIAEGVETEEQKQILKDMNCDAYQGFLLSRPIPAEQFEDKFLSH
ncbi:EAL domain-containing protein [Paenibacillus sp. PR3]|uniref:EAL domain-containing protein n=1 Tax=Paenibacillus terricola TaxID=2763503 RepID=A0ABR8N4A1_9BACL|nr:EAL domain-containing protein [Paenibacillus terricola]MBD3922237.1 EAL domain-containing protein [Paenibacillus terricola]